MRLVGVVSSRHGLEVHAYCLMGNHYHLLVRTSEANIAEAMQHLISVYTRRFNLRHGFDGALFRGRYAAVLIEGDAQFMATSRYIHRNPAEAEIVNDLADYPYSSYRAYAGLDPAPRWLRTGLTLGLFARDRASFVRYVTDSSQSQPGEQRSAA